ncbi:MAG: exodeoxyribonuclease VII large subunit [Gammaproteobacteria bacterium]|nr:exodeoxyribonuclease VII large subunit [Gammaproteobacteria bacterium]
MMRDVYSVKRLVGELRDALETRYGEIWVEGEISNLSEPRSGHKYFSLVDDDAALRCALFSNRLRQCANAPADGMQALLRGRISVYATRGDLQLIVDHLEDAGEGALRREFERLKRQLSAEGLFADRHKQPLPACPGSIGVISSPSGAALHDIRVTLKRRYRLARLVVYPASVQGERAADELIDMLDIANRRRDAEVLIVARGGGSLEDLQAFNDERVARAIFASQLPVVSAIGHEVDFTIADLVADRRAPTPTAAAEMVAPELAQLQTDIDRQAGRLRDGVQRAIDDLRLKLDYTAARLAHPRDRLQLAEQSRRALAGELLHLINDRLGRHRQLVRQQAAELRYHSPQAALAHNRQDLAATRHRLTAAAAARLKAARHVLDHLASELHLMSPAHTLERGYAILHDERREVVTDADKTRKGQILTARVARGRFLCVVEGRVEE